MNYNEKTMNREVWCPKCKVITRTIKIAPSCDICFSSLITVVRSLVTKELITGTVDSTDYSI